MAGQELTRTEETVWPRLQRARGELEVLTAKQLRAEEELTEAAAQVEELEKVHSGGGGGEHENVTEARLVLTAVEQDYEELSAEVYACEENIKEMDEAIHTARSKYNEAKRTADSASLAYVESVKKQPAQRQPGLSHGLRDMSHGAGGEAGSDAGAPAPPPPLSHPAAAAATQTPRAAAWLRGMFNAAALEGAPHTLHAVPEGAPRSQHEAPEGAPQKHDAAPEGAPRTPGQVQAAPMPAGGATMLAERARLTGEQGTLRVRMIDAGVALNAGLNVAAPGGGQPSLSEFLKALDVRPTGNMSGNLPARAALQALLANKLSITERMEPDAVIAMVRGFLSKVRDLWLSYQTLGDNDVVYSIFPGVFASSGAGGDPEGTFWARFFSRFPELQPWFKALRPHDPSLKFDATQDACYPGTDVEVITRGASADAKAMNQGRRTMAALLVLAATQPAVGTSMSYLALLKLLKKATGTAFPLRQGGDWATQLTTIEQAAITLKGEHPNFPLDMWWERLSEKGRPDLMEVGLAGPLEERMRERVEQELTQHQEHRDHRVQHIILHAELNGWNPNDLPLDQLAATVRWAVELRRGHAGDNTEAVKALWSPSAPRSAALEGGGGGGGGGGAGRPLVCLTCKKGGRPFDHDYKTCTAAKGGGAKPTAAGGGAKQTGNEKTKPTCGHCGKLGHFKMECYVWQKTPEGKKYMESDWGKQWLASRKKEKATVSRMEAQQADKDTGVPLNSLEDAMAALREERWHTGPTAQMMAITDPTEEMLTKRAEDKALNPEASWVEGAAGPWRPGATLEVEPASNPLWWLAGTVGANGKPSACLAFVDGGACERGSLGRGVGALIRRGATGGMIIAEGPQRAVGTASAGATLGTSNTYATGDFTVRVSRARTQKEIDTGLPAAIVGYGGPLTCLVLKDEDWGAANLKQGPGGEIPDMVLCPALFQAGPMWLSDLWMATGEVQAAKEGAECRTHKMLAVGPAPTAKGGVPLNNRVTVLTMPGDWGRVEKPLPGLFRVEDDDEDPDPFVAVTALAAKPPRDTDFRGGGGDMPGSTIKPRYVNRKGIPSTEELRKMIVWDHLDNPRTAHEVAHAEQMQRLKAKARVEELLLRHRALFGKTQPGNQQVKIRLRPGAPVMQHGLHTKVRPQLVKPLYDEVKRKEQQHMVRRVADNVATPGAVDKSRMIHPIVVAQKPDGSVRMCLNPSSGVNDAIHPEDEIRSGFPSIEDLLHGMLGVVLCSFWDEMDAFLSMGLHPDCFKLFSFCVVNPDTGLTELWEYMCLIFGFTNSPALFFEHREDMLKAARLAAMWQSVLSLYMDDGGLGTKLEAARERAAQAARDRGDTEVPSPVLPEDLGQLKVSDEDMEDVLTRHLEALEVVLTALEAGEASLKAPKCRFLRRVWPSLGLLCDGQHFAIDPERTKAFDTLATPPTRKTVAWLRMVMGTLVAYNTAIGSGWGALSEPLFDLLTKATNAGRLAEGVAARRAAADMVETGWTENHTKSLEELVRALKRNAVRALPDPRLGYEISSDSSQKGMGAVLRQYINGKAYVISTMAVNFSGSQLKWTPGVRELYSWLMAARRWWKILLNAKCRWVNDHHNLLEVSHLESIFVQRILLELCTLKSFREGIRVYVPGECVPVEDALSRLPGGEESPAQLADGILVPRGATKALAQLAQAQNDVRVAVMATLEAAGARDHVEATAACESALDASAVMIGVTMETLLEDTQPLVRVLKTATETHAIKAKEGPWGPNNHVSMLSDMAQKIIKAQQALGPEQLEELKLDLLATGSKIEEKKLDKTTILTCKGRVVIPRQAELVRKELFERFHNPLHDEIQECLRRITNAGVYIVGASKYAEDFYDSCHQCIRTRAPDGQRKVVPLLITDNPRPLESLMMDCLYMEQSACGLKGLILIVDEATGFLKADPAKQFNSETAWEALKQWLAMFGGADEVHVDGGPEFEGVFKTELEKRNIKRTVGTPHNSKGRGVVEKMCGRLLRAAIKLLPEGQKERWPSLFPDLVGLVNEAPNRGRGGYSPRQLLFVGTPSNLQKLWGRNVNEKTLHELRGITAALREEVETVVGVQKMLRKIKYDDGRVPYDKTGRPGPEVDDWALCETVLVTSKMTPTYEGPFIVTAVQKVGDVPTGWVKIAEIVAGKQPGDEGYPARTEQEKIVTVDRLVPFDHSRITADEAYQWRLPAGWYTIRGVSEGPDAEGRFAVHWAHRDDPTWEFASAIDHSAAFHKYCEDRKLDRVKLVRDQRAMALAGLKAKGKAAPEAPRGGRESLPRAARK